MYHDTEHYRLSFAEAKDHRSTPPELIIACHKEQLPVVSERLARLADRLLSAATTYFHGTEIPFTVPSPDLFHECLFGYAKCGYITTTEREACFHFPLRNGSHVAHTAFTIQLMKTALLHIDPNDVPLGNRAHQFDLELDTDNHRPNGYGHALGGSLAHEVAAWLEAYRSEETTPKYHNGDAPMHPEVVAAMKQTWRATARRSWQEYVDECRGRIMKQGAFVLDCFGNACDVGVYPSEFRTDEPSHSISCHNLDNVEQQLTLLAGLAKICQLARENTS